MHHCKNPRLILFLLHCLLWYWKIMLCQLVWDRLSFEPNVPLYSRKELFFFSLRFVQLLWPKPLWIVFLKTQILVLMIVSKLLKIALKRSFWWGRSRQELWYSRHITHSCQFLINPNRYLQLTQSSSIFLSFFEDGLKLASAENYWNLLDEKQKYIEHLLQARRHYVMHSF